MDATRAGDEGVGVSELARLQVGADAEILEATLVGEVDLSNATEIGREIEQAMPNTARALVLDMSGLRYIDSAGIRTLLLVAGRLSWRRQTMCLVLPEGSHLRQVLNMAGVAEAIPLEATTEEARGRLDEP